MQSQALMDAWWRGDYPGGQLQLAEDYSVSALCVYALLPPFNPFLYGFGQVPGAYPQPKAQAWFPTAALTGRHRLPRL